MSPQFVQEHFFELLADAFYDSADKSECQRVTTCKMCGEPSRSAKCDPCFRAYRVERNRIYRQRLEAA